MVTHYQLDDSPPMRNLNLLVWPIFMKVNYLWEILAYGARIHQENKRFPHDSNPRVTEWELETPKLQCVLFHIIWWYDLLLSCDLNFNWYCINLNFRSIPPFSSNVQNLWDLFPIKILIFVLESANTQEMITQLLARDMACHPCCAHQQLNFVENNSWLLCFLKKKNLIKMNWEKKILIFLSFKHVYKVCVCTPNILLFCCIVPRNQWQRLVLPSDLGKLKPKIDLPWVNSGNLSSVNQFPYS